MEKMSVLVCTSNSTAQHTDRQQCLPPCSLCPLECVGPSVAAYPIRAVECSSSYGVRAFPLCFGEISVFASVLLALGSSSGAMSPRTVRLRRRIQIAPTSRNATFRSRVGEGGVLRDEKQTDGKGRDTYVVFLAFQLPNLNFVTASVWFLHPAVSRPLHT